MPMLVFLFLFMLMVARIARFLLLGYKLALRVAGRGIRQCVQASSDFDVCIAIFECHGIIFKAFSNDTRDI